jgi:sec-independent protein translocase protein TatB
MFDVGFWELAVIAVIGLLVLGPEKLPRAARTAGLWVGKARKAATSMKREIEKELDTEDLKKLRESTELSSVNEMINETRAALKNPHLPDTISSGEKPAPSNPEVKGKEEPTSDRESDAGESTP